MKSIMKIKSKVRSILKKINLKNLDKTLDKFDKGMSAFSKGIDSFGKPMNANHYQ